ncbi:hypothetical protein BC936DRAFT_139674 [Jimgerdemannia flammicorona]|uniref:Uncharacterized protein n=1 Tax=Jimgerdemannia flammicorona TaxID=994334 RepID=A0A433DHN7_9FUNG|nr:hypothetical protein BC936DRAFT_139674 [Jimgerdemannia flammicorona]
MEDQAKITAWVTNHINDLQPYNFYYKFERIEALRLELPTTKRLFKLITRSSSPLFYYIIDHTGQHGPTADLFDLERMRLTISDDIVFTLPELSLDQDQFFDALINVRIRLPTECFQHRFGIWYYIISKADDLDNVRATTPEQKKVKHMVSRIFDSITNGDHKLTEMEHLCRNVMPLMDATVRGTPQLRVSYGERTLNATAERQNKKRNPANRARAGYKVDIIIEFSGLHWMPETRFLAGSHAAHGQKNGWISSSWRGSFVTCGLWPKNNWSVSTRALWWCGGLLWMVR